MAKIIYGSRNLTIGDTEFTISDRDIQCRNDAIRREAEQTWEVCSLLGLVFEEGKQNMVDHLCNSEDDAKEESHIPSIPEDELWVSSKSS